MLQNTPSEEKSQQESKQDPSIKEDSPKSKEKVLEHFLSPESIIHGISDQTESDIHKTPFFLLASKS